ncbi:hypothetical protein BASA83_005372 [Batrachochytrium salamandrivorans]|nr:hypothetical protein BASA83_005372 [Batrachochytrium salamandrivorans]
MPSVPFHNVVASTAEDRLIFFSGSRFVLVDATTGAILAAPSESEAESSEKYPGTEWIPQNLLPTKQIRGAAWHDATQTVAITTDDKDMQLWKRSPGHSWTLLNTRETIKRTNCLLFSPCGVFVFVGDKFGDVYRYIVDDPEKQAELILGHVSMLTDVLWSHDGKHILTADRDEKIRVSKYPHAFDIVEFCLGHEQFISRMILLPEAPGLVVSGGGDTFLIVWDYLTGSIVQKLDVLDPEKIDMKTTGVLSIKYSRSSKSLAIIFEQQNIVLIVDASNGRELVIRQTLETPYAPLEISFDCNGMLWIVMAVSDDEPRVAISTLVDGKYEAPTASHVLLQQLSQYVTETADEIPSLFEFHKLRKWSGNSHYHDQKNAQKRQRDEVFAASKKRKNPTHEGAFRPKSQAKVDAAEEQEETDGNHQQHNKKATKQEEGKVECESKAVHDSNADTGLLSDTHDIGATHKAAVSPIMLISKDNRKKIYQYLFQEGVLVAKKDFNLPKHGEIDVPNLQVLKALQSLESRGYVKSQFSWQYYYYSLTNEGIEYLREYLHLPAEIVPRTFIRTTKTVGTRSGRPEGERAPREYAPRGDNEYRRRDDGEKKEGAAGDYKPEFRGGVGRGSRPL